MLIDNTKSLKASEKTFCRIIVLVGILSTSMIASGPPTVATALKELGIGLEPASLVRALHDSRAGVRGLAAAQLAQNQDKNAIPEIEAALDREAIPQTAVNLAVSLASLADRKGSDRLAAFCADKKSPTGFRMQAALELASLSREYSCAPFVLSMATANTTVRFSGLLYLSKVPASEKTGAAFGPALVQIALTDPDPGNRQLAKQALQTLGDEASKSRVNENQAH